MLKLLDEAKPVSRLWEEFQALQRVVPNAPTITFGRFVLALDLLFALEAIRYEHNRLVKNRP